MKKILLTQGKFAIVDDADFSELSKHKWCVNNNGYAIRTLWFGAEHRPKQRHLLMHRIIAGAKGGQLVDHENGDKLDNRRRNLRISNKSLNGCNRGIPRHNTTGYKGVVKHSQSNGWVAQITVGGKNLYIGHFPHPQLAALAYNNAAKAAFGEFAQLNKL